MEMKMSGHGLYGDSLATHMRLERALPLVSRTPNKGMVAVTQCISETPNHGLTEPMPYEDAFLAVMQVRETAKDLYLDGRLVSRAPVPAGSLVFHDLRRRPSANFKSPFHTLNFYLSRSVLEELADQSNASKISDLKIEACVSYSDQLVKTLSLMLLPAFERPQERNRLFADYIILAVAAHVLQKYGGIAPRGKSARGGLAGWQERRAKEILSANLGGEISVSELAAECGLSTSHFCRCFRYTTGLTPHNWLLQRRVSIAKALLVKNDLSLSEVALACGFANHSHFSRVFRRQTGLSPNRWRRES
jgi:AraC family transcriptional regulator